jgi:hypothetical protein
MTVQRDLAKHLLESVANELDVTLREHCSCNTMLARFAGDATLLLGFEQLTPRYVRMLKRSRWKGFFGGMITNMRLPWFVPRRLRQLTPIEKIETDHPVFPEDYATHIFNKCYSEMLPCITSGFGGLLEMATTELAREEAALSQALLGLYDEAMNTSQCLTDRHRQDNVRFVIAIEHYRHNRIEEAQAIQSTFSDGMLTGWGGAQFALGICNRVPWEPYPYPDY